MVEMQEPGSQPLSPLRRFLIRHVGCVFAVIAGGFFAGAFLLWLGAGLASEALLESLSLGSAPADAVVIADFGPLLGKLVFTGIAALVSILPILGRFRSAAALAAGFVLLGGAAAGIVWQMSYREFVAVGRRGGDLVLVHLWPRPNTTIDARTVTAARVVESLGPAGGGGAHDFYALAIEAGGRTHTSTPRIHGALIERAMDVVRAAQAAARAGSAEAGQGRGQGRTR